MSRVRAAAALACALVPGAALGHAFGERYELPVPVWLFIAGGAVTVTITFVVVAAFARTGAERFASAQWRIAVGGEGAWIARLAQGLGVAVLLLVLAAGFAGTTDPNRSIAPTLVWIVWWVGFSYVTMLFGNVWPLVNPWRTLYGLAARGPARPKPWPARLGAWPSVALLLAFGWVELVFPYRATPLVLAWLALGYSIATWAGMARYGLEAWLENADPFHRMFELLGRFAPLAASRAGIVVRPWSAGLISRERPPSPGAEVAFVMALLAIVLFDGLQSSKHWAALENAIHAIDPKLGDAGWLLLHTAGLLATWLAFLGLYLAACAAMRAAAGGPSTTDYARAFAPALVPISVGYHFAHSFTYLLVQGQALGFLVSDPFGLGWDLFGTRDFTIDIAIIRTKSAWFIALGAIVAGHAVSVFLAHVVAERMLASRSRALAALVPMTALMVLYTILSLQILAEPLVRYSGPQETII